MLPGVLFAFLLLTSAVSGSEFCVLCYFTNWAQYRPEPNPFLPEHINPTICTHIVYAFANISADTLNMTTFEWNDEDLYTQVMRHKTTNPKLKVLIAIGGANLNSNVFPTIVNSSTNRETFARNAVTFLRRYQFDGLDVDWEFPGEHYKTQFTAFLAAIRLEFDKESIATGNTRLLLTAAVSAYKTEMDRSYEVDKIHVYLDYISVMGYDYYGTWSQTLGHNSPLYVPEADRNSNESSLLSQNASMTYWLAGGTPKEKLILGMSTYARTFRMLDLAPNKTTPDINQTRPGSPYDTGKGGDPAYPGGIEGVLTYYQVCGLLSTFTRVWMEDSQVPYAYGPRNDHWEWIGYDDVQSMAAKAKYIIHHDLGGAMFWSLDNDDFINQCLSGYFPLIKEVSRILNLKNTTTPAPDVTPLPRSEFCVLCYFTNWAQYRPEPNSFLPENIDPTICTHIVYAFANISADTLSMTTFEWNDEDLYARVMKHKITNPNLKVLIAIGGANLNSNTFPTIVNSSTNRETFARNAVTFLRRYQFDGLDVDWEFPGEHYKTQFTAFLSAIRSAFDNDTITSGKPRLLLTAAVSAYKSEMERSYEVNKIHLYLDYISVMGYDYYGTWSQTLGHNSPLYVPEADRNSNESSLLSQNASMTYWLAGGTPKEKLILGMSTYARTFRMLDLAPNKTTPDINQTRPGSPYDTGKGGDPAYPGGIEGVLTYYQVCGLLSTFTRVWMEDSQVPYAYGPRNDHWEWIGYDDVQSMAAKAKYIIHHDLGGAMFWSLDNDDFINQCLSGYFPLIKEVSRILNLKNTTTPAPDVTPLPRSEFCVLCYFTNWAQYRPEPNSFLPENIDPTICTHIVYAFANISADTLSMTTFEWNDEDLYARVMKHKITNPNLKVLIAIGGANLNSNTFPTIVNSSTNRETFARNAVTFLRRYQFDGLDVDWEFPGEHYKTQFTAFLSEIRSAFDNDTITSGKPRLLLTAAVSAYKSEMERSYEVNKIHLYLDYISVMGYDYYGTWSQTLGHNSPLYVPESDRNSSESSLLSQNSSVTYWLAGGTPPKKLVLGMSTYARTFRMLDLAPNKTTPGINQTLPGSPYDTGKGGDPAYPGGIEGVLTYYQVCVLLRTFTRVWMEDSQVPYAYGPRNGHWEWIAYDDVQSMAAKANYIVQYGLGGAMFWSLDNDDFQNLCWNGYFPLITEVSRILKVKNSTLLPPVTSVTPLPGSEFCILCYFTNWAQYRPEPNSFLPEHINPTICTHIVYAFANISADSLSMTTFERNDEDLYARVMKHKTTNPNLKVLIAIGGATLNSNVFPIIVNSSTNRETFARNAVTFLRRYQLDGLDVDWEFPGENYKTQFTAFLSAIHSEFDHEAATTGKTRLLLTAAVSAYKTEMERSYEVDKIHVYLDYISVMGYDYYGTWSQTLGHNSPLYVPEADRNSNESSLLSQNASVTYWLAGGTPKEKLVLGMSTYARTFRMLVLVPNETPPDINQTRPGSPYDTGKGGDPAYPEGIEGILTYYQVCGLLSNFTRVWMEDSQVPYAYGPRNDHWEWIAYDDVQSMAAKANYIIQHELGGAMFWSLDNDDYRNLCSGGSFPLITEVSKVFISKTTTTITTKPTTKIESLSTTVAHDTSGVEGMYSKTGLELNIVALIIFKYLLG